MFTGSGLGLPPTPTGFHLRFLRNFLWGSAPIPRFNVSLSAIFLYQYGCAGFCAKKRGLILALSLVVFYS